VRANCTIIRLRLPGVDSIDDLGERLGGHVETCLTCQAEAAHYRTLRHRLGGLIDETLNAPSTLVPSVVIQIDNPGADEAGGRRAVMRRAAIALSAAAGAAVAATAGTIIVIGLRRSYHAA
jgi:anti-sigma factor RsiW